jgi:hypothetical protein
MSESAKRFCPDSPYNKKPNRRCQVCKQRLSVPCNFCPEVGTDKCLTPVVCPAYAPEIRNNTKE